MMTMGDTTLIELRSLQAFAWDTLFGNNVCVSATLATSPQPDLWPVEVQAIQQACPARQLEFKAGRNAARMALAHVGALPSGIAMAADRSPVWPTGFVGSISHCDTVCIAAAASASTARSIGIDIEFDTDLDEDLWPTVCTQKEITWLQSLPAAEQGRMAMLVFAAKECTYKCQYPLSGVVLEFPDIELEIDAGANRFVAEFKTNVAPFLAGDRLDGRYGQHCGRILCGMKLPPK